MEQIKAHKTRIILARAFALLAIPVALNAVVGVAKVTDPGQINSAVTSQAAGEEPSAAEQVFRNDWGSANAEVYTRIAMAFETEAMHGADLMRVECRSTLCKVVYEAEPGMDVRRILPRQLANTFNSMVTVHSSRASDRETLVYVDVPSNT